MSCCKSYVLTYFNMTGRAETIRLIFAAGGIKFEDKRIEKADWPAMKPNTPWGGVPTLSINGKTVIGQSMAIARFAAKEACLAGKCSIEQAQVDSVAETINEIRETLITAMMSQDTEKMNDFNTKFLPQVLANLDKFHAANGAKNFLVGDKMTWADLHWYATLEAMGTYAPKAAEMVKEQHPHLQQIFERVAAHPKIAEYLKKRPQT